MASFADDGLVLLLRALDFAAKAHRTHRRKNDEETPYIDHPIEVARILSEEGGVSDPEIVAAALLHDTVEDTATSLDEIRGAFGDRVARIVGEVTDDKSLPKIERKRLQVIHASEISREARLVKLGDKLSNLRDLRVSVPKGWVPARVRGYFTWASFVVEAMGDVHPALRAKLDEVFASTVTAGGESFRAVPETGAERKSELEAYYELLESVGA